MLLCSFCERSKIIFGGFSLGTSKMGYIFLGNNFKLLYPKQTNEAGRSFKSKYDSDKYMRHQLIFYHKFTGKN